jgi:hypothetical protein
MKAMLLSKLKLVWAVALAAVVGVGAVGLTYRQAAAQPAPQTSPSAYAPLRAAQAAPQPTPGHAPSRAAQATADELEELRLEVAALRKGLEVTRERVKALEGEVRTLQGRGATTGTGSDAAVQLGKYYANELKAERLRAEEALVAIKQKRPSDPLAEAEVALKRLRANPNDTQAAKALERALKQLKGRAESPRQGQHPKDY